MKRTMRAGGRQRTGHRTVAHTADLRIEAWGPTREECIAGTVTGMVESFLGRPLPPASKTVEWEVAGHSDTGLLAAVLEEVIYRLEITGCVPVDLDPSPTPTGLRLRCQMASTAGLAPVGAIPKAVTLHELRCEPATDRWWCSATIDV